MDEEEEDRVLDELNDKDVLLEDDEVEMRHEDELHEKLEDEDCDLDEEKTAGRRTGKRSRCTT